MNEFTDREALELLLSKLGVEAPALQKIVLDEIDAGKEVIDAGMQGGRRKTGSRTEKLTDREALSLAIDILRSYFVELPKILQSAEENFGLAVRGAADQRYGRLHWTTPMGLGETPIGIEVEQRTAEKFSPGEDSWMLDFPDGELVAEQSRNLDEVFQITGAERRLPWRR